MATTTASITGTPLPLKPQIPITPPPDCLNFSPRASQGPSYKTETSDREAAMAQVAAAHAQTPTSRTTQDERAEDGCQCHGAGGSESTTTATPTPPPLPGVARPLDPQQLAMVSRIAAFYQQRCQAISNYQHQKCQAWANAQRQKCQEMTQAAMLVVAWYVRDRIQRRRKRQKRQFRRALAERSSPSSPSPPGVAGAKVKKSESVARWASRIPEDAPPPPPPSDDVRARDEYRPCDKDELDFIMDAEPPAPDADSKLYAVADGIIKSQLARVDFPIMGAISFGEDEESESESDYEELHRWQPDPDAVLPQGKEEAEEEEEDDDDEDYSYDDEDMEEYTGDDGSELVHKGTGNNTRKDGASSVSL